MSIESMRDTMDNVVPWSFDEDDVAAWSYVDLGTDRELF